MKRKNKNLLTLMLAGALCAATIGGGVSLSNKSVSAAEDGVYSLSDVFGVEKSTVIGHDENNVASFTFSDEGVLRLKRDVAFKWYEDKNVAGFFTVKFAFKDLNFSSVSLTMDSASAWATEEEKTTNTVKFTKGEDGKISVAVNDGAAVATEIAANTPITLSLKDSTQDGEFGVSLKVGEAEAKDVGLFVNVGANFGEYSYSDKNYPFQVKVDMPDDAAEDVKNSTIILNEINGQSFEEITKEDEKFMVKDNAAPVLVVNEKVGGFLLGTAFALDYEKVDVLQSSNLTDEKTYYQYNPTHEGDLAEEYKTLSTSVVFMQTVYEKDGETTSVYKTKGKELVSIKIKLGDKVFNQSEGESAKKVYDLSWYANAASVETENGVDYITIDRNEEGAKYSHIVADDTTKTNVEVEANKANYAASLEVFEKALNTKAADVYAGSNSKLNIPSVKWLIDDNNGYRNLKFTISYKTPNSDTAQTSSNLSYNGLKITTAYEGWYEFKIFANDKASNTMQYYLDGELVSVSASNIWDIEEIPSFRFEIKNQGLKADSSTTSTESSRKDEEDIGEKYTLTDIKIVGSSSLKEDYALYRINEDNANAIGLKASNLASVSYTDIKNALEPKLAELKEEYFGLYLEVYAALVAADLGGEVTSQQVAACFDKIEEVDDRIDEKLHPEEWEKHNKYGWSVASQSFTAVDAGNYVILADYWEEELPTQRVAAYKVIVVESESDYVPGNEKSWVEENKVSVILFSIAGVMLILIIILLLVKPSDETLEDVDAKAAKKEEKEKSKDEEK